MFYFFYDPLVDTPLKMCFFHKSNPQLYLFTHGVYVDMTNDWKRKRLGTHVNYLVQRRNNLPGCEKSEMYLGSYRMTKQRMAFKDAMGSSPDREFNPG